MTGQARAAHAVQIGRYGPAEVLRYAQVPLASLAAHEVPARLVPQSIDGVLLQPPP